MLAYGRTHRQKVRCVIVQDLSRFAQNQFGESPNRTNSFISNALEIASLQNVAGWWAHQDLNLEPTDYESAALTN
jgi:hypothetical protein